MMNEATEYFEKVFNPAVDARWHKEALATMACLGVVYLGEMVFGPVLRGLWRHSFRRRRLWI